MRRLAKRKKITPIVDVKGLSDKDLHCCARILQSIMFAPTIYEYGYDPFYACKYCKYANECVEDDILFNGTRQRLQALTRVNLNMTYDKNDAEKKFSCYVTQV